MAGLVPVLAHPERYWGCTPALVKSWRQSGTVIQIDSAALLAGGRMGQLALALLEEGLADCLASDNHGDRRSLGAIHDWLSEQGQRSTRRSSRRSIRGACCRICHAPGSAGSRRTRAARAAARARARPAPLGMRVAMRVAMPAPMPIVAGGHIG